MWNTRVGYCLHQCIVGALVQPARPTKLFEGPLVHAPTVVIGDVLLEYPTGPTGVRIQKPDEPDVDGFYRIQVVGINRR